VTESDRGIYSIGALSRMLGVSPATLRTWEERYAVVVPERSAGSQRLYSRENVAQLRFVCEQMQQGVSAADAHRMLAQGIGTVPLIGSDDVPERRILLVERDPYAADLAEYFLRTEGYAVDTARTVATAEELVAPGTVDLVILDLMIGGGAGIRWCEQLRGVVRVLAVSALDQRDLALAAGADAFVRKPFDALALVSAARDLVGTSALVRDANRVPFA
jgi:DNA-binding transcriptional MerR regulator